MSVDRFDLYFSWEFVEGALGLLAREQKQLMKSLVYMRADPWHPSLRTKGFGSRDGVFESRINKELRFLWEYGAEHTILVTRVEHHKDLDRI